MKEIEPLPDFLKGELTTKINELIEAFNEFQRTYIGSERRAQVKEPEKQESLEIKLLGYLHDCDVASPLMTRGTIGKGITDIVRQHFLSLAPEDKIFHSEEENFVYREAIFDYKKKIAES